MRARIRIGAVAVLCGMIFMPAVKGDLFNVVNMSGDPHIFECDLTSIEKEVTINGVTVHSFNYKDENAALPPASAGIPIQVIKVKVGDLIICRYKNSLSVESASIHWHGIELDNDSDGTAVTQDAVQPGQSYTYRFQTFRPGVFWFHSHMLPGNTLFGGMYGILIIENNVEPTLRASGTLPAEADTHTIAMSDITFDPSGVVGKMLSGVLKSENELIELCHLNGIGDPGGSNPACQLSAMPGDTVLVNGKAPDPAAQTPKFTVPSGKRIRLRLLNESISRHFRLKLLNSGDNTLYRIGGQGGLLEHVVVEGGIKDGWDTKYDLGEILLGSGMRADVIVVPSGPAGTIVQLVGNPITPPFKISQSLPANYPIAYFEISGTSTDLPPADGHPILSGSGESIDDIKSVPATPLEESPPYGGSNDETIRLTTQTPTGPVAFTANQPGIDRWASVLDSNAGNGDWLLVPRPPVARYAHVGDVLELTVRNDTDSAHPYHLHGFSMQPLRMVDNASGTTLYEFPYNEFLDTIDVYAGQSYVFRTRIDDRPKFCDIAPTVPPDLGPVLAACTANPCGGVVGRWLFHCHIVTHGALGMIGEVTVLPTPDNPPEITCPANIVQNNDPGLCSAVVTFADPVVSDDCGPVSVVCEPPSGSVFPVGTTVVTCTATDSGGQTSQCTFNVTVNDVEKPKITSASVSVPTFWSPSHDLINVGLNATATDNCAAPVTLTVKVFGDEDDESPTGDGTFSPDAKNIALTTLRLRAERNQKGDGRVYLIIITATDGAGNQAKKCLTVVAPKDKTTKSFNEVMAQAAAARAYCDANGTAPPGYFVIGDGLVIGSKQ